MLIPGLLKWIKKKLAGIILAAAGLHRLKLKRLITQYLPVTISLPAVGQGTLGLQILKKRTDLQKLLAPLNDLATELSSRAERSFWRL